MWYPIWLIFSVLFTSALLLTVGKINYSQCANIRKSNVEIAIQTKSNSSNYKKLINAMHVSEENVTQSGKSIHPRSWTVTFLKSLLPHCPSTLSLYLYASGRSNSRDSEFKSSGFLKSARFGLCTVDGVARIRGEVSDLTKFLHIVL